MCDAAVFDEFFGTTSCPQQPVCDLCWRRSMDEFRRDVNVALGAVIAEALPRKDPVLPVVAPVPVIDMHGGSSMYELTLTTTKDDPYELRTYLSKVVASRMFDIVWWEACIELTEAGVPHIHAVLYSKRDYLDASKIKAPKGIAYPYRYELKRVRMPAQYINYIFKEKDNPVVIDYCARKSIPQFWNAAPPQDEKAGSQD